MQKNNSGITLVSLATTIVILLILSTVSVNTGMTYITKVRINKILINMKLIDAKAYDIYEEYQFNGKKLIGKLADVSSLEVSNEEKNIIVEKYRINNFEQLVWYEWNQDDLKNLGLDENMLDENSYFYVNYEYGEILYSSGTTYDNEKYYSQTYLKQIL